MNSVPLPPPNPPPHRSLRVLPDDVASKIAAGEVIERPASVVRELLDNAIDAGAGHIRVELRNGGRDLIRGIDDGYGIAPGEMPGAFLRRAATQNLTPHDPLGGATPGVPGDAPLSVAA